MANIPFQGSGKLKFTKAADKNGQPPLLLYAQSTLSGWRSYRGTGSSFARAKSFFGSVPSFLQPPHSTINISVGDTCDVPRANFLLLVPPGICVVSFTPLLGIFALLSLIPRFPSN